MSQTLMKCSYPGCPNEAIWENQNGVKVCEHHKLLLDAFTWEGRNSRKWTLLAEIRKEAVAQAVLKAPL